VKEELQNQPLQKSTRAAISVSDSSPAVSPNVVAALFLVARDVGRDAGFTLPSAREIMDATGAGRTRAYELSQALREVLPTLERSPGRPASLPEPAPPDVAHALRGEVLEYVYANPGAVHGTPARRRYSDAFRHYVTDLHERHPELAKVAFAEAVVIPLGTVQEWLARGAPHAPQQAPEPPPIDATVLHVQVLLAAWAAWKGPFTAFCEHARHDHALPFGDSAIASLLELHGARTPRRRAGRTPDEEALRGQFETFFPNAQWVGDGTAVQALVDGGVITVNVELNVDAFSGAFVGIDVTKEEDSAAVAGAFKHGIETTGEAPIALLLDNKACNHSDVVAAALGDTLRIRATTFRAQNKAHVEGAFGLFKGELPPIVLNTHNPRQLALDVVRLVAEAFARGINLRPRRDRNGKSRKQLNCDGAPVSKEQRAAAEQALRARLHKQEQARLTREARQDPLVRDLLDREFQRLDLEDPERHFRNAIARYAQDTIVDSIAIYTGKQRAGTLPPTADARYLLGIAKNVDHVHESDAIVDAMIQIRVEAHDAMLATLIQRRDATLGDVQSLLRIFVDSATAANSAIAHRFWIHAAGDLIADQPADDKPALYRSAARRISNTFKLPCDDRVMAVRRLGRRVWPLA